MTRQKLVLIAAAAALSGCASMDAPNQSASLQNPVYVASNNGAVSNQVSADSTIMPGESRAMRFYWFLAGR